MEGGRVRLIMPSSFIALVYLSLCLALLCLQSRLIYSQSVNFPCFVSLFLLTVSRSSNDELCLHSPAKRKQNRRRVRVVFSSPFVSFESGVGEESLSPMKEGMYHIYKNRVEPSEF